MRESRDIKNMKTIILDGIWRKKVQGKVEFGCLHFLL